MVDGPTEFDVFLSRLPDLIRAEKVWPDPPAGPRSGHDAIALAIREWIRRFGLADRVELRAEGMRAEHDILPVPVPLRGEFCGSWNNADIALIHKDQSVAIEVDRARSKGGANVRNAMTKGSFSVLTGKFNRCHVLIFQEGECRVVRDDADAAVFALFESDPFRTRVHFFERA